MKCHISSNAISEHHFSDRTGNLGFRQCRGLLLYLLQNDRRRHAEQNLAMKPYEPLPTEYSITPKTRFTAGQD